MFKNDMWTKPNEIQTLFQIINEKVHFYSDLNNFFFKYPKNHPYENNIHIRSDDKGVCTEIEASLVRKNFSSNEYIININVSLKKCVFSIIEEIPIETKGDYDINYSTFFFTEMKIPYSIYSEIMDIFNDPIAVKKRFLVKNIQKRQAELKKLEDELKRTDPATALSHEYNKCRQFMDEDQSLTYSLSNIIYSLKLNSEVYVYIKNTDVYVYTRRIEYSNINNIRTKLFIPELLFFAENLCKGTKKGIYLLRENSLCEVCNMKVYFLKNVIEKPLVSQINITKTEQEEDRIIKYCEIPEELSTKKGYISIYNDGDVELCDEDDCEIFISNEEKQLLKSM